jgi:hypothetical protein
MISSRQSTRMVISGSGGNCLDNKFRRALVNAHHTRRCKLESPFTQRDPASSSPHACRGRNIASKRVTSRQLYSFSGLRRKRCPLLLYLRDVRTGRLEQTLYCGTTHRTSDPQVNALPQHGNAKTLHHSLTLTCKDSPSYGSGALGKLELKTSQSAASIAPFDASPMRQRLDPKS